MKNKYLIVVLIILAALLLFTSCRGSIPGKVRFVQCGVVSCETMFVFDTMEACTDMAAQAKSSSFRYACEVVK